MRGGRVPQHHTAADDVAVAETVSGGDGPAVGAEGHALNVALCHGEWRADQACEVDRVPQHHTAADADVADAETVSGGDGPAVGAEGHAPNVSIPGE